MHWQKWKHDYCSRIQRLTQNLKEESGITLVELLASLSILMVVILLAGAIHMFGQRQFVSQTESADRSNDLSYALSVMSTDLRKQKPTNVKTENNMIYIKSDEESFTDQAATYYVTGNKLLKNGQVLIDSVSRMRAEIKGTTGIDIVLYSDLTQASDKKYETHIVFRGKSSAPENDE